MAMALLTTFAATNVQLWDWGNNSRHSFMRDTGTHDVVSNVNDTLLSSTMSFSGVAFQAFDWGALSNRGSQYQKISNAARTLASAGFGAVWFPPPSKSVDKQGYMPQQWTELEGSSQKAAVHAVSSAGMVPVADVVINHRTAPAKDDCTHDYTAFASPKMGDDAVPSNDHKCGSSESFCSGCGCNNADTGDNFCACPDLDHTNGNVQKLVKDYLSFLHGVGYRGWRFDMVKGYGAKYVGQYIAASSPSFAVGEFFDSDVGRVTNWVHGTGGKSAAFDFPLRSKLKDAIRSNDYGKLYGMPGVIGKMAGNSVTFVDNHDTARNDRFGSADQLKMAYAVILTHPGTPCVFWADWNEGAVQSTIKELMKVRKAAGVKKTSSWKVVETTGGLYAAYVNNRVAVKLGSKDWQPPDSSYKLKTSGNNFAVWAK
jgi:alpha-amylase